MENSVTYWIGKPQVDKTGRFNRRRTTYKTAVIHTGGMVFYSQRSYPSYGKLAIPNDVIKITKKDFEKLIKQI